MLKPHQEFPMTVVNQEFVLRVMAKIKKIALKMMTRISLWSRLLTRQRPFYISSSVVRKFLISTNVSPSSNSPSMQTLLYNKWVILRTHMSDDIELLLSHFLHIVIGFSLIKFNALLRSSSMHSMTRASIRQILFYFSRKTVHKTLLK